MIFEPDPNVPLWDQLKEVLDKSCTYDLDWYEQLRVLKKARNVEREAELPHPKCCESARHIYASLGDSQGVPHWTMQVSKFFPDPGPQDYCLEAEVTFCPFCGWKLPRLKLKETPPPHVYDRDNLDTCEECEQRRDCICSSPESMWEVDG
jgi:hypothetical protein